MHRLVKAALFCLAAAVLWGGCSLPWFRDTEGALAGNFALALTLTAAFALLGLGAGTQWLRAAAWSALALAGQGVALQAIDAGNAIHYQHYRLPPAWPVAAFLAVQALVVAAGLVRLRSKENWKSWRVAAAVAVACLSGAAVSRDVRFFAAELAFAAAIQAINLGNILLVAASLPDDLAKRLRQRLERVLSFDGLAVAAALWVTVASALLAWFVYQRHPHLADEVAYLYNARYFALGKAMMPAPPAPDAFTIDLMESAPGQWFAAVPFGWPAVLTIGAFLGAAWLVNPLLAGLNVLLAFRLLVQAYSKRTARIAVLLMSLSPWYLFLGMSYMTHMITLACALGGFLALGAARRTGQARWAWLAGAAAGAGSLIRPLDGVIAAGLLGISAVGLAGRRLRLGSLVALVAGTALVAGLTLPYNRALTGDPLLSPLVSYRDKHFAPKSNAYGFGPERGLGWALDAFPGHTPFEALINAELNTASLNVELFGWSTGSLILIAALLVSGGMRKRDWQMAGASAAVLLAYAPYWYSGGPDFGARYWFLILVPLVALAARGIEQLESGPMPRAAIAAAVLTLMAAVSYLPWRSIDKYYHYLGMRPDVRELARQRGFGRSLVLVRGAEIPDYESAAIYNPIDLTSAAPVYAWDRDARVRSQILSAYSDRKVWIVDGPTRTHAGYRVVAGPLTAGQCAPETGEQLAAPGGRPPAAKSGGQVAVLKP